VHLWTTNEELLLRAALAPPEAAAGAWGRLRPRFHFEHADHEWYRMIPFVWRNLSEAGVDDPEIARMKGVFRRTWADTHVLLHDLGQALHVLKRAGIDTLVIKGAGLIASGLMDPGTRLMDDIDIVVAPSDFERAEHVLADRGWLRKQPGVAVGTFGVALGNSSGRQLDLHPRVAPELTLRGDPDATDAAFWSRARPITVKTASTRTLAAADHLMLVCVHGFRGAGPARLHWVPDAAVLLHADAIDWDTLVEETQRRRVVLIMRRALAALRCLDLPVPAWVTSRLDRVSPTPRDHLITWARECGPQRSEALRLVRYCSLRTATLPIGPALRTTPAHVRRFYRVTTWREVPGRLLRRVLGR
jgi:hypothetical protein